MKVLFLAQTINIKARTGDAVHVRELAINLAKLGHHVSLIAGYSPEQSDELQSLEKHPKIQISYNKNFFKIPVPRSRDISSLWICLKVARRNPPDVIYERSFSPKIGMVVSKILRKPLVVEINGIVDEEAKIQGKKASELRSLIGKKMRGFFFRQANKMVAVTTGIKKELVNSYKIPPNSIEVIPNGANTDIFKPMDQEKVRVELCLSNEFKYVCFVGNLAPWQGVEYLIQAAPRILKTCPDAHFLIVGDGQMKNEWMESTQKLEVSENFIFTGSIPFVQVPLYINASDVCVAPFVLARNDKIGLSPLKVYEYMACGKTVVASRISGVSDLLKESSGGIAITPEKPDELADTVIKLLQNEDIRKQMGINGREYVVENYSWARVVKKVADVCENVISQHN